jgi:hypothetical protein
MRWNSSSLIHGVLRLFSVPAEHVDTERKEIAIDNIRFAMIHGLGEQGTAPYQSIKLRVTYANDLMDLWYLRGDLMAAIAALHGEPVARKRLEHISAMFHGLVPKGLTVRNSPLVRA